MYVISQGKGYFGASALAYPEVIQKVSDIFGTSLFILPSSQQDLITLPFDASETKHLKSIVQEVNRTAVSKEDWLSDSVYYYDHVAGEVKLVA